MNDVLAVADRRYQVFVSSTFDLQQERKAAVEAVFERGHLPIALERFSPANESDQEVIRLAMERSQVYLAVVGHRYGTLMPDKDCSFQEYEYDLAQHYGLKTLTFLLAEEVVNQRRSRLDPKAD